MAADTRQTLCAPTKIQLPPRNILQKITARTPIARMAYLTSSVGTTKGNLHAFFHPVRHVNFNGGSYVCRVNRPTPREGSSAHPETRLASPAVGTLFSANSLPSLPLHPHPNEQRLLFVLTNPGHSSNETIIRQKAGPTNACTYIYLSRWSGLGAHAAVNLRKRPRIFMLEE